MAKSKMVLTPDQQLVRRTQRWAVNLGVNPSDVIIADVPKKWGTCDSSGVITLSPDLTDMPDEFQDYVVVHELLHLRYPNHGKAFDAMMTATIPNWRLLAVTNVQLAEAA